MAALLSADLDLNDPVIAPLDDRVIGTLIENHRAFLRHLESRLHNRHEAEDILQDVYLRVMAKAGQIREPGSIRAWLYRVLTSVLTDHFRKNAATKRQMQRAPDTDWLSGVDSEAIDAIICDCVHDLLPGIKNDYAEILYRADLLQEPRSKIARELGLTQENIRVRLHRARKALGKLLELSCLSCPDHGFLDCCCARPLELRQKAGKIPGEIHQTNCNDLGSGPSNRVEGSDMDDQTLESVPEVTPLKAVTGR